jgi:hypothetical protein
MSISDYNKEQEMIEFAKQVHKGGSWLPDAEIDQGNAGVKPSPHNSPFLPQDAKARKGIPIATGCLDYFPKALAEVAGVSRVGNEQHNPGKPLHWDRTKSTDEADCLVRHFLERGTRDKDGLRHSAKVAWRALALLEKEIEADLAKERDAKIEAERREIRDRNTA